MRVEMHPMGEQGGDRFSAYVVLPRPNVKLRMADLSLTGHA
jgi:hypothetical protein